MTWSTALRVLGFSSRPDRQSLRTRYRTLMRQHHPDVGGETLTAAAIVAAYQYLNTA